MVEGVSITNQEGEASMMTRNHSAGLLAVLCCLALSSAGCLFGGGGGGSDKDKCKDVQCPAGQTCNAATGACEGGGGGSCIVDADCNDDTKRCDNGQCVSKCAGVICGSGETCNPQTGQCESSGGSCTVDADCADNTQRCDNGTCVSKCEGVVCDTTRGQTCEPTTGQCVGGSTGCTTDADCDQQAGEVCDTTAGECKGGPFFSCTSDPMACATGYDCVNLGRQGSVCLKSCADATECTGLVDTCVVGTGSVIDGYCFLNFCRPGGDPQDPTVQDAQYLGPCDAAATGDGVCVGPLDDQQGNLQDYGLCFGSGQAGLLQPCNLNAGDGDALACAAGYICGTDGSSDDGLCVELCSVRDAKTCQDMDIGNGPAPAACQPVWEFNGACLPSSGGAEGSSCDPMAQSLPCADGLTCDAPQNATMGTCASYCSVMANDCAQGTCTTAKSPQTDGDRGVCR
ncbi:MAG: hypothetical protein D6729_02870 [Deltaproteobacteria bacterium]|nr:MAG: hypothetical protein D6729_02870 [Deltaproteobacteria bacterium]